MNNVILNSDNSRTWLASKLTLLYRMALFAKLRKAVSKPPKIWMVTGLQYIEDATISTVANAARSTAGNVRVPFPDPSLVAAIADIPTVQGGVSSLGNEAATSDYDHADERIWAAQFRPLKVEYRLSTETMHRSGTTDTTWIKLCGPENLRHEGIRTEEGGDEEHETRTDCASLAQIVGIDDIEIDQTDISRTVLDSMLDVDWVLLDEMLSDEDS